MQQKILIVEDETDLREVLMETFEELGLSIVAAKDGINALEILQTNPRFSIVMTDVRMPRMDGIEFMKQAKATLPAHLQPRAWVAFTAHVPSHGEEKKLEGFDETFYKPFNPSALVLVLKSLLRKTQMEEF